MILHLVHDDKVVPRMISQFEEVNSGNNIYICVSNLKNREDLRFLGNSPNIIMSQNKAISKIPWERVDKVCFHYLSFKKIRYYWELCSKYNISHAKNIWFMWGGDIYDILERKGLKLYHESNTFNQIRKDYNKGIFVSSRQKVRYFFSDYFRCLFFENKFDYVICNSKEEFELFCKYVRFSKCKELLHYHYYPIEDTLGCLIDQKVHGNSVIIGNSASPTNNHEYVVSLLKKTQLSNRRIYIPLSYSINETYIKAVETECLGLNDVVLLKKFLPIDDYYKILTECSTFIYGNYRQEGWGNILIALYLGGKVYVSKNSIYPAFLKSMGFKFFITEDLNETYDLELTAKDKENNRSVVLKEFSRDNNIKHIRYICNI